MIKNNILSLVFHISIAIIFILLNRVGYLQLIDDARSIHIMVVSLLVCPTYIIFGYIKLKDAKSKINNFLSTISIILISAIIWTICLKTTDYKFLYTAYEDDGFV